MSQSPIDGKSAGLNDDLKDPRKATEFRDTANLPPSITLHIGHGVVGLGERVGADDQGRQESSFRFKAAKIASYVPIVRLWCAIHSSVMSRQGSSPLRSPSRFSPDISGANSFRAWANSASIRFW